MKNPIKISLYVPQHRILAELDALLAEVDVLKRLQTESGQCPHSTLDALLPAILDRAFKGELA